LALIQRTSLEGTHMEHLNNREEWFLTQASIRATGWKPNVPARKLEEWPLADGVPHKLIRAAIRGMRYAFTHDQLEQMWEHDIEPMFVLLDQLTRLVDHVDRERGAQLEARAMALTDSQLTLAELWLESLRKRGLLTEMMDKVKALGVPTDLGVAEEIADARLLLSDAWGIVNDGHFDAVNSKLDHEQRALAGLLNYVDELSKDDPELPVRLLWAIVLAFLIGEHRESDEDSRMSHVNHELSRETIPGQLLPDPIGGDFDFDFDGEVAGMFARRDHFIDNPQVNKKVCLGRTKTAVDANGRPMWDRAAGKYVKVVNRVKSLGFAGLWVPKANKDWSFYKPVGLLRRGLMHILRGLAAKAQLTVDAGGELNRPGKFHVRDYIGKHMIDLKFRANPKAPMRITLPLELLVDTAYHLRWPETHRFTSMRGELRNPTLAEAWERASKTKTEEDLQSFDDKVKMLPNGLTPKQAYHAALARHRMRIRGAMVATQLPDLRCKGAIRAGFCRPLFKMYRELHIRPLLAEDKERIAKDILTGHLLTHREFVRLLRRVQLGELPSGMVRNNKPVIEVAIFGDIVDLFRELIGLPGGAPPTDKVTRGNGRPRSRQSAAQLVALAQLACKATASE
jgi:hypothetical protein